MISRTSLLFGAGALLLAVACSGLSDAPSVTPTPPAVDTSISSVILDDVVFDLFDGGYVLFPEASAALIVELRDAIGPIYEPVYGGPEEGDWLPEHELVIGYTSGADAYAYPVRMLNFHELVADTIDDVPLLVTY